MNKLFLGLFVAFLLLLLVGYAQVFKIFGHESSDSIQLLQKNAGQMEIGYEARAQITSVDPIRGTLTMRVALTPGGLWVDEYGCPNADCTVSINGAAGKSSVVLKKGEVVSPIEVVLSLSESPIRYPHDAHEAELDFAVSWQDEQGSWLSAPIRFHLNKAIPGYRVGCNEKVKARGCHVLATLDVIRSRSVIIFSSFLMTLIGLLGISALALALAVVGGRKVELPMLAFLATQMFALLPLRNAMPDIPPIGVLSDYMAFFWSETLTALALLSILFTWLHRRPQA